MNISKETIKSYLKNPPDLWKTHELGMLFINISPTERIHLWDNSLKVDTHSLHDHPWHIDSTIITGTLYNTRYVESLDGQDWNVAVSKWSNQTDPRNNHHGGPLSDVQKIKLLKLSTESYSEGQSYHQQYHEIHSSYADNGTVTYVRRIFVDDPVLNRTFWINKFYPLNQQLATNNEIDHAFSFISKFLE